MVIPSTDMEITKALESRMINSVEPGILFEIFKASITKCYAMVRWEAPTGKEFTLMIDQVMQISKSKYGTIRENEVSIALTRGVLKEYGEYMGLSIVSFVNFIKGYLSEESRIKLLAIKNTPVEEDKTPTAAEQTKAFISRLEELFVDYKSNKSIMPTEGAFYFEKLWYAKVIRFTSEQREELKKVAFARIRELKNPKNAKSKHDYNKAKNAFSEFLSSGLESDAVKREAMYLGLLEWFKQLSEFDLQISDEIQIPS